MICIAGHISSAACVKTAYHKVRGKSLINWLWSWKNNGENQNARPENMVNMNHVFIDIVCIILPVSKIKACLYNDCTETECAGLKSFTQI